MQKLTLSIKSPTPWAPPFMSPRTLRTSRQYSPCVETLIKAGVTRVVVGTSDPDGKVSGKGLMHFLRMAFKWKLELPKRRYKSR